MFIPDQWEHLQCIFKKGSDFKGDTWHEKTSGATPDTMQFLQNYKPELSVFSSSWLLAQTRIYSPASVEKFPSIALYWFGSWISGPSEASAGQDCDSGMATRKNLIITDSGEAAIFSMSRRYPTQRHRGHREKNTDQVVGWVEDFDFLRSKKRNRNPPFRLFRP